MTGLVLDGASTIAEAMDKLSRTQAIVRGASGAIGRPRRLLPDRVLPAYAYLPGRHPHPVRDPGGHSYGAVEVMHDPEGLRWGIDLFDQGYPWEAHEAWEPLWFIAERASPTRALYKGLILLAASGLKIREGRLGGALKHAGRSADLLRLASGGAAVLLREAAGVSPDDLADRIEASYCAPLRTGGAADLSLIIAA